MNLSFLNELVFAVSVTSSIFITDKSVKYILKYFVLLEEIFSFLHVIHV